MDSCPFWRERVQFCALCKTGKCLVKNYDGPQDADSIRALISLVDEFGELVCVRTGG